MESFGTTWGYPYCAAGVASLSDGNRNRQLRPNGRITYEPVVCVAAEQWMGETLNRASTAH
jgi:hypothetical protein